MVNNYLVDLSIIIVNYNGRSLLQECLDSIIENCRDFKYEIIVVDNGSHDESVELIKHSYPHVKLVISEVNLGFAGGNNLGAKYANGEYLLLLNNDTIARGSFLPLIAILRNNLDVGVVGCELRYKNNKRQESIGYNNTPINLAISWLGLGIRCSIFRRTLHFRSKVYSKAYQKVNWVCGACFMTRKTLWQTIGGLDKDYFMYVEDVDYCKRVSAAGYSIVYTNKVVVTHYVGSGKKWIGEQALLHTIKSYKIYSQKFYGKVGLLILRFLIVPTFVARSFWHCIQYVLFRNIVQKEKTMAFFKSALQMVN